MSAPTTRRSSVSIITAALDGIWYRQSSDGLNWTAEEQVSSRGSAAGVGQATRIIVMYSDRGNVFVRTGNP